MMVQSDARYTLAASFSNAQDAVAYCLRNPVDLLIIDVLMRTGIDAAVSHGFAKNDGVNDCARRFQSALYAMAKGAWYSPMESNRGNGFWFMRTAGYSLSNITYICDFGHRYNRGTDVTCNGSGFLPAVRIDLSKAAGKVTNAKTEH